MYINFTWQNYKYWKFTHVQYTSVEKLQFTCFFLNPTIIIIN